MQHAQSMVDSTKTPKKENQSDALAEVNSTFKKDGFDETGYIASSSVPASSEMIDGAMVGAGDGALAVV